MPVRRVDPFSDDYAYVQVADDLARRIAAGEFTGRLPAERALAEEYGVAYATARKAIDVLRERGLVRTAKTRGTYVATWQPGDDSEED